MSARGARRRTAAVFFAAGTIAALAAAGLLPTRAQSPAPASTQTPPLLPKGVFPDGILPAPSSTSPAKAPDDRSANRGSEAVDSLARDNLGRIAVPPPAQLIDLSSALSPAARAQIEAKLAAFETARGSKIAVITVPSTQPEPIEDFANRVFNAWKLGRAGIGDGVLMVVATQDRRARIEVSRALEGAIPDVAARQIIRDAMGPRFAASDFAGGISAGLDAIFKRVETEGLPTPSGIPQSKVDAGGDLMAALIPLVIIGALVGSVVRRIFGVPGAAVAGAGVGTLAGVLLSSLLLGAIAGIAVFIFSSGGWGSRGGGGRVLGGRRGGPVFIPGGWSGGGGWGGGGGGGGGWSSGGGGDGAGGGASGDW